MKTAELTGALLDYWVARAEGFEWGPDVSPQAARGAPSYSKVWDQGGPLIDKYRVCVRPGIYDDWVSAAGYDPLADMNLMAHGPTPLVAICRAVVRSAFGDEVPE